MFIKREVFSKEAFRDYLLGIEVFPTELCGNEIWEQVFRDNVFANDMLEKRYSGKGFRRR